MPCAGGHETLRTAQHAGVPLRLERQARSLALAVAGSLAAESLPEHLVSWSRKGSRTARTQKS